MMKLDAKKSTRWEAKGLVFYPARTWSKYDSGHETRHAAMAPKAQDAWIVEIGRTGHRVGILYHWDDGVWSFIKIKSPTGPLATGPFTIAGAHYTTGSTPEEALDFNLHKLV